MTEEFDSSTWAGDKEENSKRLRSLIQQGAKVAGGAVGAALGFFAAGPAGAAALGAAGTMASEALAHIGEDVSQRMLGPRERVRVGGVIALTAQGIQDRLRAGKQTRSDGFFDEREDGRSNADEIAESIITKAQRESEEKKLPYMSKMLANIAFETWVTLPMAQQLAKTAEVLTFRQFCILRSTVVIIQNRHLVRQSSYRTQTNFPSPLLDTLYEIHDLVQRGLITIDGVAALGLTDIEPSKLKPQGLGVYLYNLMELDDMPHADVRPILEVLKT
ncbi:MULTISPECIES: hypothetical protein [unclassified Rhizobium]|uniref:hypothetical protein n=1 Tax=unclassified Rhizobium TaxID=2613769 RepID=UPI00288AFF72|nr:MULTISPECIES: hypothetical protein [unclassified Rhizobium]